MAVPVNKMFPFGRDYAAIEPIYGHAVVARPGIVQALSELIAEGWIAREETPELIRQIMCGNGLRFNEGVRFVYSRRHRHQRSAPTHKRSHI
ncbi:hypothetical protein CWO91_25230 [Bradyrhizobium genosp. SA-3]|uniref:hypothetical protein n=1 Tax=Bradyrhizobium genosp. SA-3 TaxID=508868 RepID=UPI00102911BD|nr:hypothetical protein [Bradyrhizobium genosp. SA-3]RZN07878.1 hypothetical protein CWO91_25230 [Bradyrhizobium genosp. SA-3]